jgi:processive 1,2-diacylglycerol beta-glucosyltransferase
MAFCQTYDNKQILQRYGLDPAKKIVLILAGAYGVLRNSKKICQELLQLENIEVILVCGKNKSLIESMEASFPHEPRLHVLGFVEQIHELMVISSCMITKAGGITLSEAMALNLPFIVFRPLPGQEKDNALFLAKKGTVLIAYQIRKLGKDVQQVLNNSLRQIQMEQAIYELQKTNATETVVNDVLHDIELAH